MKSLIKILFFLLVKISILYVSTLFITGSCKKSDQEAQETGGIDSTYLCVGYYQSEEEAKA